MASYIWNSIVPENQYHLRTSHTIKIKFKARKIKEVLTSLCLWRTGRYYLKIKSRHHEVPHMIVTPEELHVFIAMVYSSPWKDQWNALKFSIFLNSNQCKPQILYLELYSWIIWGLSTAEEDKEHMVSHDIFPVSLAVSRPMEPQWLGVLYTWIMHLQKMHN